MKRILQQTPKDIQSEPGSSKSGEPVFLAIGKLCRPHGISGEILLEVITDFPERIRSGKTLFIGEKHQPHKISGVRPHQENLLIHFEDINLREDVSHITNLIAYVKANEIPPLATGKHYFHEIIGMAVFDEAENELGLVTEILETGANDVYVVRPENGKELLLPAIPDVIQKVDLENKKLIVRPQDWN